MISVCIYFGLIVLAFLCLNFWIYKKTRKFKKGDLVIVTTFTLTYTIYTPHNDLDNKIGEIVEDNDYNNLCYTVKILSNGRSLPIHVSHLKRYTGKAQVNRKLKSLSDI